MHNKKLLVRADSRLLNRFQKACKAEYKSMSEVVRDSMLQFIKEHENEERFIPQKSVRE
jgi:metal-responsive CopG/Arc/MetJ family transcriptional regulator|tara:strand:+ start:2723 stop:2899 length:177 start_codon:yes stop_codon:yes gene_type:complete